MVFEKLTFALLRKIMSIHRLSEATESINYKVKRPHGISSSMSNIGLMLRISVVISIVEATIMFAFSIIPLSAKLLIDQFPWLIIMINAIVLTLASSPIIYLWAVRPFVLAQSKALSLLKDSEQRYSFLFAHLPQGVTVEDYSAVKKLVDKLLSKGVEDLKTHLINQPNLLRNLVAKIRLVDANHALLDLFGFSSFQKLCDSEADLNSWWNDDWRDFYASEITSFTSHKKFHNAETTDTRADNSKFVTKIISSVIKGNEDTWNRVLTIHEDITIQSQREKMLRNNKNLLQRLVKKRTRKLEAALRATEQSEALLEQCTEIAQLGFAIWDVDLDRDITVSKELAIIHGLTVDEYLYTVTSTEKYLEFVVPDDRAKYLNYENTVFADHEVDVDSIEYRIIRADGQIRYLNQRSQPIQLNFGQKNHELVVIQDVTVLKRAEISLKKSLKALEESEERFLAMARASPFSICIKDLEGRFLFTNLKYKQWHEINCSLDDKTVFDIFPKKYATIYHAQDQLAFEKRKVIETENEIPMSNGQIMSVHTVKFPLFSQKGELTGIGGINIDVSERKAAAAQIIQSSKLATLGEMATSVAHELNQPLNVIRMAAGNGRRKISNDTADLEYLNDKLERIEEQTARAAAIISHMRMFGRNAKEDPESVDPRNVVTNALELMGEQLRLSGIEIVTELAKDCAPVLGHAIQMEQVILNLLTNARDAMVTNDGEATITLRVFEDDQGVHITSEDTGGGIPKDVLPRIFEPFYTTKEMGKGTGLGLSVSYGIVHDMNGTIVAENINDGVRFTITLPIVR
jgi:PAS domain S-box-containing protein